MAIGKDGAALRQLRTIFNAGPMGDLSDGQLLERFATDRGEPAELAFAVLVERHGPMVSRVCRVVLADPHDCQDAFQATFLVLVRKARGLWVRDSLGPWLHRVAYRTASCSRAASARRRRHERLAATDPDEARPAPADEIGRVLHDEIERLPERYRAPIVLCDLEGRSHEEAARQLGWPIGTVKSRLSRGRQRLRDRLVRRGLGPAAGMLAATAPPALLESTTVAVVRLATARAIAPGSVVSLAREVLRSMILTQWMKAGSALLLGAATAAGVGSMAQVGAQITDPRPGAARAEDLPSLPVKPGKLRVTLAQRGNVEPARVADVHSNNEINSAIIMIKPEETRVKKGDVVCELDSAALRDHVLNQRSTVQAAEAAYRNAALASELAELAVREYTEGTFKQDQAALIGQRDAARSAIQKAQDRLARSRIVRSKSEILLKSEGHVIAPRDLLADLDIADRIDGAEEALAREKLSLELSQSRLETFQKYTGDRIRRGLQAAVGQKRAAQADKESARDLEQGRASKLERQIEACTIRSPSDGLIVYASDPKPANRQAYRIEEGATVRERQKILSVVDIDGPMDVVAWVGEPRVDQIKLGSTARIEVDAYPGVALTGKVVSVSPRPDPNIRSRDDQKIYPTRIRLDRPFPGLRPGMTAQSEILLRELDDVLAVPVASVVSYDGKDHLAVKRPDGGADWREVTLGATNGEVVEVKQGLRSGDVVVLNPLALLSEAERRARYRAATKDAGPQARPR